MHTPVVESKKWRRSAHFQQKLIRDKKATSTRTGGIGERLIISATAIAFIFSAVLIFRVEAQGPTTFDFNATRAPTFQVWDQSLRAVGWYITPNVSLDLTRIETNFHPVIQSGSQNRTVTAEILTDRRSFGGTLLRSVAFDSSTARGQLGGGSFAPVMLAAGTTYFIGFRNIAGIGINTTSVAGAVNCGPCLYLDNQTTVEGQYQIRGGSDQPSAIDQPILRLIGVAATPTPTPSSSPTPTPGASPTPPPSGPQLAIYTTTESSNRIVIFPDVNDPSNQTRVQGLPVNAKPHGADFFAPDGAVVADAGRSRFFVIRPSTATLLSIVDTPGYEGWGTIAVAPSLDVALAAGSALPSADPASRNLNVIQGPFGPSSTVRTLSLPSPILPHQTQAITFDSTGRAFVYHQTGISVLDPPYASIAFTIPLSNPSSGAITITPDGNTLLATTLSLSQVRIFHAPFSAVSTPDLLTIPGGENIDGIKVTPDGSTALVVSSLERHVASISAPFSSASIVETLTIPPALQQQNGFEDVGISSDGQFAMLGGDSLVDPPVIIRSPFSAAGAVATNQPILGVADPARGQGCARFAPPGLAPGLTITKTAPATIQSGEQMTYLIIYDNTGTSSASNVVIRDPLPVGTTFVSATNGGTLSNGNVVFNIDNLPNGVGQQTVQFTVVVNTPSGGSVVNSNYTIAASGGTPIVGPPVTTAVNPGNTQVGILYGLANGFGTIQNNQIYRINPSNANLTNFNQVTLPGFSVSRSLAMAARPSDGVLFAVIRATALNRPEGGSTTNRRLVTIEPETGIATDIGLLSDAIASLAFRSDGTLIGVTGDGGTEPETLFQISTTTAAMTRLFMLGNGADGETIAIHPNGLLYHASGPRTGEGTGVFESVDLTTQTVSFIGTTQRETYALGYSKEFGQMFLSDIMSNLYTINLTNGITTFIGPMSNQIMGDNRALAFVESSSPAPSPTPTPSPVPVVTISGRVVTPSMLLLRGAIVRLTDSQGVQQNATTSSFGVYTFQNVRAGESYIIGVLSKRYRFAPKSILVEGNLNNVDFIGLE